MNNEIKYLILFIISVITFIVVIVSIPQYLRQQQENILTTAQAINKSNEVIIKAIDNLYNKLDHEAEMRTNQNKLIVSSLFDIINETHGHNVTIPENRTN
jgi:hypothetical protein